MVSLGSIPSTLQNIKVMLREEFRKNNIKCPLSLKMAHYYLSLGYIIVLRSHRINIETYYMLIKTTNSSTRTLELHEDDILNRNDLRELLSNQKFHAERTWILYEFSQNMLYNNN